MRDMLCAKLELSSSVSPGEAKSNVSDMPLSRSALLVSIFIAPSSELLNKRLSPLKDPSVRARFSGDRANAFGGV